MHVTIPKGPINWFKMDEQSRQQELRAYGPNIYTVLFLFAGAIMEEMAKRLLNLEKCKFEPRHKNNLANDFKCYANYDLDLSIK